MQIVVKVMGWYDWQPAKADYEPTEEEVLRMDYKQSADETWLKKVLVEEPTETQVNIPESQIESLIAGSEAVGLPKTREQMFAWFLEEKMMPHCAPQALWESILIDGEPEMQAYFDRRFDLTPTKEKVKQ